MTFHERARGAQQRVDVRPAAHFGGGKREHPPHHHAPSEEVHVLAPQTPRRRAGQGEFPVPRRSRERVVNLVEQRRQFLHLVDHDPRAPRERLDLAPKRPRLAHQAQQLPVVQEVVPLRARQLAAQPGGLSGAARAEEQERARRQGEAACIHGQHYNGKYAGDLYRYATKTPGIAVPQSMHLRADRVIE